MVAPRSAARRKPITRAGQLSSEWVYDYLVRYKTEHGGRSPTIREIAAAAGGASTSVIVRRLRALAAAGMIVLPHAGQTRHIALPGERWFPPPKTEQRG